MDIVYHLSKMEEVLRTAPRENDQAGLYIRVPEDTAQLWRNNLVWMLTQIDPDWKPTSRLETILIK